MPAKRAEIKAPPPKGVVDRFQKWLNAELADEDKLRADLVGGQAMHRGVVDMAKRCVCEMCGGYLTLSWARVRIKACLSVLGVTKSSGC
jgi:hypothetical protein